MKIKAEIRRCFYKPKVPETASKAQKLGERQGTDPSLTVSVGTSRTDTDLGLLVSRTVRQ